MISHFEIDPSANEYFNYSSSEMSVLYKLFYFEYLIRSDRQKYKRETIDSSRDSRKMNGLSEKYQVVVKNL